MAHQKLWNIGSQESLKVGQRSDAEELDHQEDWNIGRHGSSEARQLN